MAGATRRARLGAGTAALLLAACGGDSPDSAEYEIAIAERDDALDRLDVVSRDLDEASRELDTAQRDQRETQESLSAALSRDEELTAELQDVEAQVSEQLQRVSELETALAEEAQLRAVAEEELRRVLDDPETYYEAIRAEVDAEVERVCAELSSDTVGDAVAMAESLISYDARWDALTMPADVLNRVETCAAIDWLVEIALGFEFGDDPRVVRKWPGDVGIAVVGSPTDADLRALDATIADLDRLIEGARVERVAGEDAEIVVHLQSTGDYSGVFPDWAVGQNGFFVMDFCCEGDLTHATVFVDSEDISQELRDHLLREEVTQAFGLARDSFWYGASIFENGYTTDHDYAAIDEVIVRLLYRAEVRPGMDEAEVRQVLDWTLRG